MTPTPIIIDCDPGIDDAIAIMLAVASPEVELLAVTTVAGNVGLGWTSSNAVRILELLGRTDIPVAAGAARPLVHPAPIDTEPAHGTTGLGGADLPAPSHPLAAEHAVDLIARLIRESAQPITLVAIAPLTNIALLAARYPDEYARLGRLVIMGGSMAEGGNVTSAAEFNVWYDPEAAARVLGSGVSPTLIGLDVTNFAVLRRAHIDRIRSLPVIGTPLATMLEYYARFHVQWYGIDDVAMHDSLAVAEVIDPSFVTCREVFVQVDTSNGPARAATLVDRWGVGEQPANARWASAVDADRFTAFLMERLQSLATCLASGEAGDRG